MTVVVEKVVLDVRLLDAVDEFIMDVLLEL